MIRIGNTCISSTMIVLIVALVLIGTMAIASILNTNELESIESTMVEKDTTQVWIPTKEDIAYQDSMFSIVEQTSHDVDTIKAAINDILYKLERLEYADGSSDSIRYEEGGAIDERRNGSDEEHIWIGGDGDTIWE